jgi:hypothetical protein
METQKFDREEGQWVAPLESIETFPVAEFTQAFSNPGDDGAGIFTGS